MSACPSCGREVVKARVGLDAWRVLDAEPSADGEWAIWSTREGVNWITHARHNADDEPRPPLGLRRLHACERAGQQLELGGSAA